MDVFNLLAKGPPYGPGRSSGQNGGSSDPTSSPWEPAVPEPRESNACSNVMVEHMYASRKDDVCVTVA